MAEPNKQTISVKPVVGAIIAVFIFVVLLFEIRFFFIKRHLNPIAEELLRTQTSSQVVLVIGESKLSDLSSKEDVSWKIYRGDSKEVGDGKANAHIIYIQDGERVLGLRMLCTFKETHIVGYWTPRD